jgi:hypothetical protein
MLEIVENPSKNIKKNWYYMPGKITVTSILGRITELKLIIDSQIIRYKICK